MEAPAKSGGTRKQRNGRDLIGRLGTFPPIRFLTRHNPLRRKTKIKLGFDQPPHEIQDLALPLRTLPPPLRRRIELRLGRWWCKAAVVAGRVSGRVERVKANIASIATHSTQRIETLIVPAAWEPMHAPLLMARTQHIRRALAGLIVGQWIALAGLCAILGVLTVNGRTWDNRAANLCGLMICLSSFAGLFLHTWYQRLVSSWRLLDLFMCGDCGELRNFSPSLPCPRCASTALPVFPGQVPALWTRWAIAINAPVIACPSILSGIVLLGSRTI